MLPRPHPRAPPPAPVTPPPPRRRPPPRPPARVPTPKRLQPPPRHTPQALPLAVIAHSLGEVLPRRAQRRPPSARNEQAQVGLQARSAAKTFDHQERTRQLIVPRARRAFLRPQRR